MKLVNAYLKLKTRGLNLKQNTRILFVILGVGSTLWFLIRVIPKPSRAAYPCMRAASPFMSGFIIYLISVIVSLFAFKKALHMLRMSKYTWGFVFIAFALTSGLGYNTLVLKSANNANDLPEQFLPNQPIGDAKGIYPGRVVWAHDPDATNKYFSPAGTEACYEFQNNDSAIINELTKNTIRQLTGKIDLYQAWDTLFKFFNFKKQKGNVGYVNDEKVFIKINCNSAWGHPSVTGTEFDYYGTSLGRSLKTDYSFKTNALSFGTHDGGPYVMYSILNQLVNYGGVPQENISIGDPMRDIQKYIYDYLHNAFPNVHYLGHSNTDGRTLVTPSEDTLVYFSDKGKVLRNYNNQPLKGSKLYSVIKDADYIINLAALKAHSGEGMTSCAKNYFGTIARIWAIEMHNGMVSPDFNMTSRSSHSYRVLVDLMGSKHLGGKTMLFLVDGTYFSPDAYGRPVKFRNAPFNNDWPSSVLASQDNVAIESVCYDIIANQYYAGCAFPYITMKGICEHLEQAADPSKWPVGIVYNPDRTETPITSLGVYEHWNNVTDQQYSRNLKTGNGIELIKTGPIDSLIASPVQLIARPLSDSTIVITWKDNSEKEEGYIIEISENDNSHYSPISTVNKDSQNYICTNLKKKTTYYFRVQAFKGQIKSGYGNEVSASTEVTGLPTPKLNINQLKVIKMNGNIQVSFKGNYYGKLQLSLLNYSGQTIITKSGVKQNEYFENIINVKYLRSGLYIVSLNYENKHVSKKVVL